MKAIALTVVAAMAVGCVQAEAAVFTFNPTSIGPSPLPFVYTAQDATFTLGISDAAVRSGSFIYDYRYAYISSGNPPQITAMFVATGDVQDLLFYRGRRESFVAGGGPGGISSDVFNVNLQFTPTGEVSSGRLYSSTDSYGIDISGSGGVFNGSFYIGNLQADTVTGTFTLATSVPEPATSSLLAAGFTFIAARRRQTIATVSNAE